MAESESEILVGQYLFRRLKELGIQTIFGVPGDFELALLDLVEPEGLTWLGTPNELVGTYAADGYARVKGAAAVITTFGPGELSALCGIAGAFCEFVPVLHIVGYPTTAAQKSGKILHHTLGDGSYEHYVKISDELSCASAVLKDPAQATFEIDRVLNSMMSHSQTGYIGISEDVAYSKVSKEYLQTPLIKTLSSSPAGAENKAVEAIIDAITRAKAPVVVVDGGAGRYHWREHIDLIIAALKLPFFVTCLGKGLANETSPYYRGAIAGAGSPDNVIKAVASADVILWFGNYPSDFNTGIFTEHIEKSLVIDFQRFFVKIGEIQYDARITSVLPKLTDAIKSHAPLAQLVVDPVTSVQSQKKTVPTEIEQDWFWDRLSTFIQPGDMFITETGTAQFGILDTKLTSDVYGWTQGVYGSIGYAAGAAVGASVAAKELGRYKRLVLLTGEGSLQLTIQAFSILNRFGITPVVFVLNNKGYTVERFFRGWTSDFNNVPDWDYGALFKGFAPDTGAKAFKVTTSAKLDTLLSDPEFNSATVPQLVDVKMDMFDAPTGLKNVFAVKKSGQA